MNNLNAATKSGAASRDADTAVLSDAALIEAREAGESGESPIFKFRLYVAGDAANSVQAIANLTALCRAHLPGAHQIEVVDVLWEPRRAAADRVYLTPTLIKLTPGPMQRFVGTLSPTLRLLNALELSRSAA
jgi:circadian clock protein KaiB